MPKVVNPSQERFINVSYASLSEILLEVSRLNDQLKARGWVTSGSNRAVAVERLAIGLKEASNRLVDTMLKAGDPDVTK